MKLDRSTDLPLYHQLARRIQGAIETGELPPGSSLGNEILLAQRFGVSRPTMRHAIQTLVDNGLLVRKRGVGTQVVHGPIHRPIQLTSLYDDLEKRGECPRTTVLSNEWVLARHDIAGTLSVPVGEPVLHLRRLRLAKGEPLAILENYLPGDLAGIGDTDLSAHGLYQTMRDAGIRIAVAKQRIAARAGTADECRLLEEPPDAALLTADRLTLDDTGRPVEWGRHVYRPSMYSFTVTVTR
ncbi:GntR family transcriptional regulator [Nakamurella sp. GG22]